MAEIDHNLEPGLNPIDIHVGRRVRDRRQRLGWTLMDLAERLGVSHQQVQKYEQGSTRISASALYQLSKIFQTNQNYFFVGLEAEQEKSADIFDTDVISLASQEKTLSIVLIEDDSTDELLMRKAFDLIENKVNLHTLHDGDAALDFLRQKGVQGAFPRPDLIILDLNIPKRDGHMLLREIKRDRNLQEIPVVVMTNSLSKKEMAQIYRSGAAGYICKPFDFNKLKESLEHLVGYWAHTVVLPTRC
jgi:CheY-like chemotaxis protein/plasmid maintenance system antidote protein VapI